MRDSVKSSLQGNKTENITLTGMASIELARELFCPNKEQIEERNKLMERINAYNVVETPTGFSMEVDD